MTSIVNGGGSTANFETTYDDVQLKEATNHLDVNTKDTTASIAPAGVLGVGYSNPYVSPSAKVMLPQPTADSGKLNYSSLVTGLKEASKSMQGKGIAQANQLANGASEQKTFYSGLNTQIKNLTDAELKGLEYQPEMTPDEVRGQLLFAALHPEMEVPANVRVLADQVYQTSLSNTQQEIGQPNWNPASLGWVQDSGIMMHMQTLFQEAAGNVSGLSKEDKAQLHFVMENPKAFESLSPELKEIFKQVMGSVHMQAQKMHGIPDSWQFPSDEEDAMGLSSMFDSKIEHTLSKLVDKDKLSKKEAAQLSSLHYDPNASFPDGDKLKAKLAILEKKVLAQLQEQWGFPPGYRPPTNSSDRTKTLNISYQSTFDKALKAYSPPLTEKEAAEIRAAQASTDQASLSPELQKASSAIKALATQKVISEYGLSAEWSPEVGAIIGDSDLSPSNPILGNILKALFEHKKIAEKTVASLPEGQMKAGYMVFLSVIGSALAKLAEVLTRSQVAQANISKTLSQTKLDQELTKIKHQMDAFKEMQEKQEKGGFMGFLSNAMNWIMNAVVFVFCAPLAIATMVDAAQNGQDLASLNMIDQTFVIANRELGKPLGSWVVMLATLVIVVVLLVVAIVVTVASGGLLGLPAFALLLGPIMAVLLIDTCYGGGSYLTNSLEAFGIPPMAAMIITMIVGVILSIIVDIIICAVIFVATAGVGTEVIIGIIGAQIAAWAGQAAAATATAVVQATIVVIEFVIAAVQALGKIGEAIAMLMRVVFNIIKAVIKMVIDTVKFVVKTLMKLAELLQKLISAIKDACKALLNELLESAAALAARLTEKLTEKLATNLPETIAKATSWVGEKVTKALEKAAQKFAENAATYTEKSAKTFEEVKDIAVNISKSFSKTKEDVLQIAKDFRNAVDAVDDGKTVAEMREATAIWKAGKQTQIDNLKDLKGSYSEFSQATKSRDTQRIQDATEEINKLIDSVADSNPALARRMTAKVDMEVQRVSYEIAKDNLKAAKEGAQTGANATSDITKAKAVLKECTENLDKAVSKFGETEMDSWTSYILKTKNFVKHSFDATQSLTQVQTNILQGQMAMLKAAMDAYNTQIEYMIKLLTDMISRLLSGVTSLGEDISSIGKQIQQLYKSNSQTMSSLSTAA